MCGIFGYVGKENAAKLVLEGLKKLEYRGYDSAGIAGIKEGEIYHCKEVGKLAALDSEVKALNLYSNIAVAHTRWATHGKPNRINAHPHLDEQHSLALVHNGIIENHEILRSALLEQGAVFISETDTEVVAHLISSRYQGNMLETLQQVIPMLQGAFAIALLHKDYPETIFAIAHECPFVIGIGKDEAFVASDSNAFSSQVHEILFLNRNEIAMIQPDSCKIYDLSLEKITKPKEKLSKEQLEISKGDYAHYTLKEIYEQPESVKKALLSRISEEYGTAIFEEINIDHPDFLSVERILILACGSSWNAGYIAAYMIEDKARIPVQVEISSEFRYKNPIVLPGTLAIALSQSGETADTVAAVRELKAKGAKVLAICNVQGSTLAREADTTVFLRAGPEIGVCSTKAVTSQLVVLSLLTLMLGRMRHMSKQEGQEFIQAIRKLPDQVQEVLDLSSHIEMLAKKYSKYENFFFLGRRYMFPASLEGALKLKEISYINANGYPAGEMKHGPIALINEECPTIALCANVMTFDKLLSNLMEVKARNGFVLAIAGKSQNVASVADDVITIPDTNDELAAILSIVAAQLFAYYIAKERGADIDQPRNLAKSVTVE